MDNLEKLTKADLIWVIRAMEKGLKLPLALIRLEEIRQQEAYDRADALYRQASEKRNEYLSLVKEYCGKPIKDMPAGLLMKATRILDEAKRLEREADRLYGIKE